MEMGSTFTSKMPKFPTEDPNYRIIRRVPSCYLHYYFYVRDPVIGPLGWSRLSIGTESFRAVTTGSGYFLTDP
jgi:hypothetical protein